MHDPQTVAFEIRYPWRAYAGSDYRPSFITIWHVDPETDGTDDSCGRFKRARHGDKAVLARIAKRFASDWDRTFESDGRVYSMGMFSPAGGPRYSAHGIIINLFFVAAIEALGGRKKAVAFGNGSV